MHNLDTIEVPRWVKKFGHEALLVHTRQELRDALSDGWVLRLPLVTVAADPEPPPLKVVKHGADLHNPQAASEPIVESPEDPEPDAQRPESGVDDERGDKTIESPDPLNLPVKKRRGRKPKVKDA